MAPAAARSRAALRYWVVWIAPVEAYLSGDTPVFMVYRPRSINDKRHIYSLIRPNAGQYL